METPREHIEEIRKKKFSIGGEENPLTEDLHQAVKNLSSELYAKDVHFLMELIQNVEDNNYLEGVDPSLEFIITSQDITATGAPATLLIFNNEKGFSSKNIDSICSVGRSTKKGNRKHGYIGDKGIGFKSVFLVTARPYIFSNGYQIRFNEEPCPHCNLGYIVPEWVEENPTLSDIMQIYGSRNTLPKTTIVLPLKPDKVKPVKEELSSIHPEVLLFLSKVKRFSVREHNKDATLNTVSAIAITSETDFVTKKNIDAESFKLHLSTEEKDKGSDKGCSYYIWKQNFPVKQENKVERRMGVEELVITLAFPFEERHHKGMSSPGVYAFLPTEMITNFPFIIQADFLLSSSRETILLDNKWNKGILDCVPFAFINALVSLVKTAENVPISSLATMFKFIPINSSSYQELNIVRESIKEKLVEENIVPSESYTQQKFFHKPRKVRRLMPAFWNILEKAKNEGVSLCDLSSHGNYILSSAFDNEEYDQVLSFLGVEPVNNNWYVKCIGRFNLIAGVTEELYLEILLFVADNWKCKFDCTNILNIPLIKYVGLDGNVSLCSINECAHGNRKRVVSLSPRYHLVSWLIDWNREFKCVGNRFFVPKSTQEAISSFSKRLTVWEWLQAHVKINVVKLYDYAVQLINSLNNDRKLAVAFVHFLYHSLGKNYLSKGEVDYLCGIMPLVDDYGNLSTKRKGVLVPANGSKWVGLIGSNPWRSEDYVELAEDYFRSGNFAGEFTSGDRLLNFLKTHVAASDVPYISPPNAAIPAVSSPLTSQNAFLLLDWIRNLKRRKSRIPEKFLTCIREGNWCKITASGCSSYKAPSRSFMFTSSLANILQNESVPVDIPLIDKSFYGERLNEYKEELKTIGVMFQYGEAYEFIGLHLISLAASSTLTRGHVLFVLKFTRLLREDPLTLSKFIKILKKERWLRTSCGDRSPDGSVLLSREWRTASQISRIPCIDIHYYGEEILAFKMELRSLGVLIGLRESYNLIADNLKSSLPLTSLTAEAVILILECIRLSRSSNVKCVPYSRSSNKLIVALKAMKCFKTNMGYNSPGECLLFDSCWVSYLKQTDGPFLDEGFYGSYITYFKEELNVIGVTVDVEKGCPLIASHLDIHLQFSTIVRIYNYLSEFNWEPDSEAAKRIWIPNGSQKGKWVSPGECVLHDKDGLFSWQLHVLEKHYEQKLLTFFSNAFHVRHNPSFNDYCKLWKVWESSGHPLSHADCCKFWVYVSKHWSAKTERTLADSLAKLPVGSGSDRILLSNKHDVFIADELQLKDLFEQFSPQPIFVWYPRPSLPSLPRKNLLEIYRKIGVCTISESVHKEEIDLANFNQVNPKEVLLKKGLVRLILGFLADPTRKIEMERRREIIKVLLNITFLETVEPIPEKYSLSLSSGKIVKAKASRVMLWHRESSKFVAQKLDRSVYKNIIEHATYFSELISEGLLWENSDHIGALSELIKLGFMLEFNEEAVGFLMKSKNLQIFTDITDALCLPEISENLNINMPPISRLEGSEQKNEDTLNNQQTEARQTFTRYSSMSVALPVEGVESVDDDDEPLQLRLKRLRATQPKALKNKKLRKGI